MYLDTDPQNLSKVKKKKIQFFAKIKLPVLLFPLLHSETEFFFIAEQHICV